jgi:rSAM/selenodomain-associated transferase 1
VKYPEPGKVKTRLEPFLGSDCAARLYECFVLDLLETLKGTGFALRIVYDPPEKREEIALLFGEHYDYRPQEGADLGERMKNAFLSCFAEGVTAAVLLGSDLPDLSAIVLEEAFSALEDSDGVLGPSVDGGYYLVGFRKKGFCPAVFDGIPWSTERVFPESVSRFHEARRTVALLPPARDLDTPEDLMDFRRRNLGTPFVRSRTITLLHQLVNFAEIGD